MTPTAVTTVHRHSTPKLVRPLLLIVATTLMGLSAGFFYAYEASVRRGLALADDAAYVTVMDAINSTVQNAVFAVSFFGAAAVGLVALATQLSQPRALRTWLTSLAVGLAFATIVITVAVNVPLNRSLAAGVEAGHDPTVLRANYEDDWNRANRLRALTSTGALAAAASALAVSGSTTARVPQRNTPHR